MEKNERKEKEKKMEGKDKLEEERRKNGAKMERKEGKN